MRKEVKNYVEIIKKKSSMTAEEKDYPRLEEKQQFCLDCKIEKQGEEIKLTYDIRHVKSFCLLRKEEKLKQITVLAGVYQLNSLRENYSFSMNPENLYYDMNSNVYVLHKDLISKDYSGKQEHFLEEYKALTGFVLQKKYSYEDYLEGGLSLLKRDSFLKHVYKADTVDEVAAILENHYDEVLEIKSRHTMEIKRSVYRNKNVYIGLCSITLIFLAAALSYLYFYRFKEQNAVIQAYGNYLVEDYIGVIDASEGLRLDNLDSRQKYILAVSYVKGENLTAEQKNNIISLLLPEGEQKELDYWIELGRSNMAEAENIALQCSNDELLLYAYLKEKQILETNTEMTGTQKSEAISAVQGKIDSLSEQYTTEEEADE